MSSTLDIDFVRSQFPAFSEPSLLGWAFFENAGGSYPCVQTIERLTRFYRETKVQPYYDYAASQAAGAAMDESHTRLASYLNVEEDEVIFGPSTSQNTYVLAEAFAAMFEPGDEIIVSNQDHEANAGVWRRLESRGIVLREWTIDPDTGKLEMGDLEKLLNVRTRLAAFPHCSNVVGGINPVAGMTNLIRNAGALSVVDGVAYAPHGLPDVKFLGADIYMFSTYKTWGPHLGLMTVRRELMEQLPNQSHYFNEGVTRKKLVPAGPDHGQVAAAAGIAEYLDIVHEHHFPGTKVDAAERGRRLQALFTGYERSLLDPLLGFIESRDDLRLLGPSSASRRAPTVSLVTLRKPVQQVFEKLAEQKIMAGMGHFYGVRPLEAMDVPLDPGVLRLSFLHYTHQEEIEQLISGLHDALD